MFRVYLLHKKTLDDNRIIAAAPSIIPLLLTVEVLGTHGVFEFISAGLWEARSKADPTGDLYQIYAVPYRNSVDDVRVPLPRGAYLDVSHEQL
jgi:hypothetical protein